MLISSKGRYALRLMIYIAALGDAEGKIALREVADREHISQKYLEQLVRPLMKAGLLKSVRGRVGVSTQDGLPLGMTIMDRRHHHVWTNLPEINVAVSADYARFLHGLIEDFLK